MSISHVKRILLSRLFSFKYIACNIDTGYVLYCNNHDTNGNHMLNMGLMRAVYQTHSIQMLPEQCFVFVYIIPIVNNDIPSNCPVNGPIILGILT